MIGFPTAYLPARVGEGDAGGNAGFAGEASSLREDSNSKLQIPTSREAPIIKLQKV
jgi:hypothetical protein